MWTTCSSCLGRQRLVVSSTGFAVLVAMAACFASGQPRSGSLDDARGKASYYADEFAGETTASGETFDPDDLTAAHPSLPFDTIVRVTRVDGARERSVEVRINDRGPYADDRIIDLSAAAAEKIGMIQDGIVEVKLEIVELSSKPEEKGPKRGGDGW